MSLSKGPALRLLAALIVGVFTLAVDVVPADAQYFGRNKVQYRTFEFEVLRTEHFDIYYYPEAEQAARDAARMAERWYTRLSRVLDYEFEHRQPVILYATHPHFQQTTVIRPEIGDATGGVTEAFKQRIVMPFGSTYAQTDHVLGHEIVHAFQYDISGLGRAGGSIEEAARRFNVPLWFVEGMAEYLTLGPVDPHTSLWLRDAALTGRIPTVEQLTFDPRFFPYRWGHAFWAYVGGRWGDAAIGQILKQVGQGVAMPDAFQRILNTSLTDLVDDWGASIRRAYLPLLAEREEAREVARPLITHRDRGGRINLAPMVSPDGRMVAFLSELSLLDVELWVADAETGEPIRRLVKGTSFDPHFGSLRFVSSAGTWSPDSRQFAFAALRRSHDVIVRMDVENARIVREYSIPGVDEMANPTWSPDGRTLVVSGMRGGINNLYAIDVETGATRQITDDRFAYVHAAYSPDGRSVAVSTDRATANFETLSYGNMRVGLVDVATGEFTELPGMEAGKNINPSWGRDGASLFFVSDRAGISNIYRLELADGTLTQVTNLFTGLSGFAPDSPVMSAAMGMDRLVFTAYERGGYNIYSLTGAAEIAGVEPREVQVAVDGTPIPALLPPVPRPAEPPFNRVLAMIADDLTGLPPLQVAQAWRVDPYRPRLSLDFLGQPTVGVGVSTSPFSRGGLYGGITGIFSDMLGYHTVFGTVQAQGQLDEIGFSVAYLNERQRLNWGAVTQRIPYLAGFQGQELDLAANEFRDQLLILRYFDTSLSGIAQYPFSRVQRVEFSGGVRRIGRDIQIREFVYRPVMDGNQLVGVEGPPIYRERSESLPGFNLAEAAAALVYDNALYSFTAPFAGQRYRFEANPTVGTLQFTNLTADYRRYLFMRPFTLAVRGLHFGRYGRDEAELSALFLGNPVLMRGYAHGDVARRCQDELGLAPDGGTECQVYRELFGSRVGVANAELRMPMMSLIGGGGGGMGLPPIEPFAFMDAGISWGAMQMRSGQIIRASPRFERGVQPGIEQRGILTSGGAGARMNLFGYMIVEAVYVNAFERDRGWHWQFSFQPGF